MSRMDVVKGRIRDSLPFYTVNVGYMLKETIECACWEEQRSFIVSVWERKRVRLWAPLHNWPLPSKPTAMDHLQTNYCVLICLPLFPTAALSTQVTQKQACCSLTALLSNMVDQAESLMTFCLMFLDPQMRLCKHARWPTGSATPCQTMEQV